MLRLPMGTCQDIVQFFSHSYRFAFMANNIIITLVGNQAKHLFCPKSELSRFNCGTFGIAKNSTDVFVALLRNEGLVSLFGRKGEDVFVQEVLKFWGCGEAFKVRRRLVVKLVAQLGCGCGHKMLLLFGARIDKSCVLFLDVMLEQSYLETPSTRQPVQCNRHFPAGKLALLPQPTTSAEKAVVTMN